MGLRDISLDIAAGMNMGLTGRENARLMGRYRRLDRAGLEALVEDAAAFSGSYSSGMLLRLAFAIATLAARRSC